MQKFQKLQNLATKQMLRAFRGSPFKALEIEAAIPPPKVRFEKAYNSYSLRILLFQKDHPVKQAIYNQVQDKLQNDEDPSLFQSLQLTTQLLSLACRLKKVVKNTG